MDQARSVDSTKIRDALAATQGHNGITGSISISPGSRVPDKTVSIIGVKNDKPNLSAEVTPSWMAKPQCFRGRQASPASPSSSFYTTSA